MTDVNEEYVEPQEIEADETPDGRPEVDESHDSHDLDDSDNQQDAPDYGERPEATPEDARLAKLLGWKEPTEWKGDTTNYMSAEKYLEIHSKRLQDLPEIQTRAERAEQELQRLRRKVMERFEKQDAEGVEKLKAERDKAFDLGDKRAYDALNQRIEEQLARPREQADPEQAQRQHVQQVVSDTAFQEFASQNPWFESGMRGDPEAAPKFEYANFIAEQEYKRLGVANPLELPDALRRQVFSQVASKVKQFFPEQKANNMPNYQPGSQSRSTTTQRKKGPSFDALPQDAKQAFQTLSRRKIYQDTPEGRLEYAREYSRDNA